MDINPGASGSGSSGRLNSFSNGSDASLNSAEREKSEESAARRFIDQLNSSNADRVSLSYKSRQLHSIQAEFFSGPIRSDQIPELTQRLFEGGLLSSSEYQQLGGVLPNQKISAVSESVHFLNRFILDESVDGDTEGAKSLLTALSAIEGMNLPSNAERRAQEQEALQYVSAYTDMLKETGAPADIVEGFENVTEVLQALDKVRNNEARTGALASYASVEDTHKELFDK